MLFALWPAHGRLPHQCPATHDFQTGFNGFFISVFHSSRIAVSATGVIRTYADNIEGCAGESGLVLDIKQAQESVKDSGKDNPPSGFCLVGRIFQIQVCADLLFE